MGEFRFERAAVVVIAARLVAEIVKDLPATLDRLQVQKCTDSIKRISDVQENVDHLLFIAADKNVVDVSLQLDDGAQFCLNLVFKRNDFLKLIENHKTSRL